MMALTDTLFPSQQESVLSAENTALAKEEDLQLLEVVLALPLKYRKVILLYYYKNFSVKEISSILCMKEASIKSRLSRARKLLQTKLQVKEEITYGKPFNSIK
jgi:RNA polymerase sigma-70 factor, ECF subfamily